MSATTELLILQAAPAPTGALALGVPRSDAEYEAFSETLKAELKSGQASSENGKSLPRGGDNLPDGEAETQLTGATAAADQKKATMPSADDQPSDANAVETVASETDALTSLGTARDASEPVSRADASGETALPPLTDAAAEREVMPSGTVAVSAMNDALGNWTRSEISERLDAISQLLASNGEGALPGKLDPDLHQKLAQSAHSVAAIEQRLGQLAGAGVLEFTEAAYRDGTPATVFTGVAAALVSDETMLLAMADSTSAVMNANKATNNHNAAGGAVTPAQSQRLDAILNMMASSGQGGIQGAIAADLQQALADSDASLDSIQLRLQTLSSEGATHFNKANYFADRSLSERPVGVQEMLGGGVALARANQAVDGSPDATVQRADAVAAARAAAESTRLTSPNASSTTSTVADQLAGDEVDPRRAAMAFAGAQNKQIAGRADAMSPDVRARTSNLTADDLQQALSAPRVTESQVAAREAGSTTVDRNTAVTLSPAQMAEQRRAGQSVASSSLNNSGVPASELKVADTGRAVTPATELADLKTDIDGPDSLQPSNVARARMAAAIDSRPAASSSAAALDPMAMAQRSMQDASSEGRFALDLQGNRSASFELPQATNTASSAIASTIGGAPTPSGLPASASSASPAAMRAGGEHMMQNVPWAPQFTDEVSEQVRVFVNNGLQEARLQLTPAELGRVQITINTEGDNARVVFVAETAVARDLLDQSMPRLREMLQQSGIQLAQGDVSDQTESQRRGEPLDEDAQRVAQGDSDAQADGQTLRPELANVDAEDTLGGAGRVDTYI
jgi:flagellar hook-length control protein FliK